MSVRIKFATSVLACVLLGGASSAWSQQKPQWMPGQVGLNAGILPSPGFTYVNMAINYDAGSFNDRNGNAVPVTGNYNVWAIENIFYYVPNTKFLGGNLGFMVIFPTLANGSLVADFPKFPNLGVTGGGYGVADLWVQPFTLGWHLKRADIQVGDAFMVPTGRYTPGATNNIGTGYFGNHLQTGTTLYVTKNKATRNQMPERAEKPKTGDQISLPRLRMLGSRDAHRSWSLSGRTWLWAQDLLCRADLRGLVTSTWSNSNDGEQYEQHVIRGADFSFDCLFVSDTERCPEPGCNNCR